MVCWLTILAICITQDYPAVPRLWWLHRSWLLPDSRGFHYTFFYVQRLVHSGSLLLILGNLRHLLLPHDGSEIFPRQRNPAEVKGRFSKSSQRGNTTWLKPAGSCFQEGKEARQLASAT
mmetsp:Transcript_135390/g.239505  ORF Transcript_135390/g.239505 Transcript_135390/m.239505 type:complete len:119 (-) Transcript_135390:7-363(-)